MGRLEQGYSMLVGMVVDMEEQEQLLEEEQALGRGMAVVVAGIPTRVVGFGQWQEEELAEGEQAWLERRTHVVDMVVVDVGGVVDLLGWGWWWRTTIGWAGGSTHWSHTIVSTRDCASLLCGEKKT